MIYQHRSNTLERLARSTEGAELDVHVNFELTPMVVHDEHQPFGAVQELSTRELIAEGIYPLSVFLELAKALHMRVFVDIKINTVPIRQILAPLEQVLHGHDVAVTSFSRETIVRWKERDNHIPAFVCAWEMDEPFGDGLICPAQAFDLDQANAYRANGYLVGVFGGVRDEADFSIA